MRSGVLFALAGLAHQAHAQIDVQKFELRNLSFQYTSNNNDERKRCLNWAPLEDKEPTLQYDDDGNPFMLVRVQARVRKGCSFEATPLTSIRETEKVKGDQFFEVTVRPPVTVAQVKGQGFEDTLVFEAPVERLKDISFFSFFQKSKVSFETRYASAQTNVVTDLPAGITADESGLSLTAPTFPVFGGNIYFPLPWTDYVGVGYGMYQNLGNFAGGEAVKISYSETVFSVRGQWRGPESWGRPEIAGVLDYRSRNLTQTDIRAPDSRVFVFGSTAGPGFGADVSWFIGAAVAPWENPLSRFGLDLSARYYIGKVKTTGFKTLLLDAALNYRITRRWALGAGFSMVNQSSNEEIPDKGLVEEKITNFFLRLTLVPYIGEEG